MPNTHCQVRARDSRSCPLLRQSPRGAWARTPRRSRASGPPRAAMQQCGGAALERQAEARRARRPGRQSMPGRAGAGAFAAPAALPAPRVRAPLLRSVTRPAPQPLVSAPRRARQCASAARTAPSRAGPVREGGARDVSVVLLAGGRGKRMGGATPKQFLHVGGVSVLERSLSVFRELPEVRELVVVLAEEFHDSAAGCACRAAGARFAAPGRDRADSVRSGAAMCAPDATLICVHDAARPLVSRDRVREVIRDAWTHGAAVLAVPCKATVKTSVDGQFVAATLDRSTLWEMQTPQVVDAETLRRGLRETLRDGVAVTDDVSVVEHLGLAVKITAGDYSNVKITTPEDLVFAEAMLADRAG